MPNNTQPKAIQSSHLLLFFPLHNQKSSNVLGWHWSVAQLTTHMYATSATNPEEVNWNTNHYILHDHMQQSEKVCLCIIGTMRSCRHQYQLSHRVCKQPKNPHTRIQLTPPQEWRLFSTIPPFEYSTLFLFFSLYFYQDYCFQLGSLYSWLCSRAWFTYYLNSCKLPLKTSSFPQIHIVFSLAPQPRAYITFYARPTVRS